jgi:hypothetical protein
MSYQEAGQLTFYQARLHLTDRKKLGGIQNLDNHEAEAFLRRAKARKEKQRWPLPVVH